MAKLVLLMDGVVLKEIPLKKERTTIGRRLHNDIVIDNLAVSGEHAVVTTVGNQAVLEDLESTNGTIVNGQVIKKHALQNSDVIELGKYLVKFIEDSKMVEHGADLPGAMNLSPDLISGVKPNSSAQAIRGQQNSEPQYLSGDQSEAALPPAFVRLLNGVNVGKEMALSKALTTIGRPGNQVAVLTRRPEGYFITAIEGPQPTVNGQAIGPEPWRLEKKDVLELSGIKLEFDFKH